MQEIAKAIFIFCAKECKLRRIYPQSMKRRKVVQDALAQMQEVREHLGPEMIERIKALAGAMHSQSVPPPKQAKADVDESEPVDRGKNMLIIMKFLQMKGGESGFQNRLKALLSEQENQGQSTSH